MLRPTDSPDVQETLTELSQLIAEDEVWTSAIENSTETDLRRTTLALGVGYGDALDVAQELILETVRDVNGVADEPVPQAFVHEFGDSSINLAVRFWHESPIAEQWRVRDEVARGLKRALDGAGVEIPFPQGDLHVQAVPSELSSGSWALDDGEAVSCYYLPI